MALVKQLDDVSPIKTVSECKLTVRLLEMLQESKYQLVQENGQRRLTAPEIVHGQKERIKGAEIFLGRLPRDLYEDELMPVLQTVGRLMELRLMLDFSGSTRGYAFALFEHPKIAKRACRELDGYEIRPGHHIGVVKSVDNCRLFFGGVPKDKTKEQFLEELNKILEGITDVYLYPSAQNRNLNRGFIFVEFTDHRAAAMARRKLIPGKVTLWNHEIAVDWADPEPGDPIDEEMMETVSALFVRNLSLNLTQQKMKFILQKHTKVTVLKLKKINHFAFVHYESHEAAKNVLDIITREGGIAEAEGWEIRWAKPIGTTKMLERQRCINAAVAKSGNASKESKRYSQKSTAVYSNPKSINANTTKYAADKMHEFSGSLHISTLQNFVKEKFNALCTFEVVKAQKYTCKIVIHRDEKVLFKYPGEPMPSKQLAIVAACMKIFQYLYAWPQHPVSPVISGYYEQPQSNINPAVGAPVQWLK